MFTRKRLLKTKHLTLISSTFPFDQVAIEPRYSPIKLAFRPHSLIGGGLSGLVETTENCKMVQLYFAITLVAFAALLSATVTAEPVSAIKGKHALCYFIVAIADIRLYTRFFIRNWFIRN